MTSYLHLIADEEMSYDHLASGLKATLESDKSAFDADRLQKYTGKQVSLALCLPEIRLNFRSKEYLEMGVLVNFSSLRGVQPLELKETSLTVPQLKIVCFCTPPISCTSGMQLLVSTDSLRGSV